MTFTRLPNGRQTYVGRRGRTTDAMTAVPKVPGATRWAARADRTLEISPLALPAPVPLLVSSAALDKQLTNQAGYIVGWSLLSTATTTGARVEFYDGTGTTGQLLAAVGIAAGTSSHESVNPPGWTVRAGVYQHIIAGPLSGVLWFLPTGRDDRDEAAAPGSWGAA